ncbi:MAG: hypothetical protein IIA82_09670 [Thaumarchaeota archaeon]|nr:hypothetical protein [Nitrososphaerota archaeon]
MNRKNTRNTKGESYVKATITSELDTALNIIEKKLAIPRADIVRASLYEYIKNFYPGFLPKNKDEILNEVKEKYYFKKFSHEFEENEYLKQLIPNLENYKKELADRLETSQIKLNTVNLKIQNKQPGNEAELQKLQKEKNDLDEEIKRDKLLYKNTDMELSNAKKGIAPDATV